MKNTFAPEAPQDQMFATPYGKVSATKLISALNAVEMLPEIKAQRDELLAACKAWEYARNEGGISMVDWFEVAWKKTQTAIANIEKGAK